jgi:hypothetical protein
MTREGEISPSRLTIAQASLLNLHGKNLNPPSQPQLTSLPTRSSLLSVLPRQQPRLPSSSSFDDGESDGQGLYYQFPAPPSTRYAHVSPPPLLRPPFLLPREAEDHYESLSLESLPGRGSSSGSSTRPRAGSELGYVGLPPTFSGMGNARAGGYTPAEELILQAHSQRRSYPGGASMDSVEVPGGRKGGVAGEGEILYSASQQQPYRLDLHSYRQQPRPQQQQQTITTQFNVNKIGHSQNIIQQRTHHISNTDDNHNGRRRALDFEQLQQYRQLQQQQSYSDYSTSSYAAAAQSIISNNASVNQLRIPTAATTTTTTKSSGSSSTHLHRHQATPPPLLSNDLPSQRYYHYQLQQRRHENENNVINYNDNHNHNHNNTIILPQANQRALVLYDEKKNREEERGDGEKNAEENTHMAGDAKGSPFFEYNQHHHDDAMRHAGAVHRYSTSKSAYDSARFVVQTAVAVTPAAVEEMKVAEEIVSPALTYGSTSSRTPSTLSPATPFFGTFGPPPLTSSSQGALGKERDVNGDGGEYGDGDGDGDGMLEVAVPRQGGRLD